MHSDERLAGKSKAEAHALLNHERELFQKSFKLFDNELEAQGRAKQDQKKLFELRSMGAGRTQDLSDTDDSALFPHHEKATIASHHSQPKAIVKAMRPLWGTRKWPSYYKNVLADKSSFSVDAPKHVAKRADARLDHGDDDKAIDQKGSTVQRCSLGKPCINMARVPHAAESARGNNNNMQPHEYPAGHDPARYARREQEKPQSGPMREAHGSETRGRMQQMWQEIPTHPSLKVVFLECDVQN